MRSTGNMAELESEMEQAIASLKFQRSLPAYQPQLDHRAYDLARFAFYDPSTVSTVQSVENAIAVYLSAIKSSVESSGAKPFKEGDRVVNIEYATIDSIDDDGNAEVVWETTGCMGDIEIDRLQHAAALVPSQAVPGDVVPIFELLNEFDSLGHDLLHAFSEKDARTRRACSLAGAGEMSAQSKYWRECMSCAAEECNLVLTEEQLSYLAETAEGARENYGMAFYQPESPYPSEIKALEDRLAKEVSKVVCRECWGDGRITTQGPYHSSNSQCWKCHGEGKVQP